MGSETRSDVELDWIAGVKQIDDGEYLFVDQIRALEELTLAVTLTEAKPQAEITVAPDEDPLEQLRVAGRPIERDATCRSFRPVLTKRRTNASDEYPDVLGHDQIA